MNEGERRLASGMTAFWIVWAGQLVSLLGSGMTQFALVIWVYQETGRATNLALVGVFFMVPLALMSPVVGVMVDRYDRKLMMMLSDLAAGVTTLFIFVLYSTGYLQVWHLYLNALINGIFQGFQWPAYSAALALMIPKEDYVRVNSLLEVAGPGSQIVSPLLGGAIIGFGAAGRFDGLRLILVIDIVTFLAAIASLLLINVPKPARTEEGKEAAGGFFKEAVYGFKYIWERPPLLALQGVFMLGNLLFTMATGTLLAPMLLARTSSNAWIFGSAQTISAIGMVAGGLVLGAWGGFRRRVHGVLVGWGLAFVGTLITGLGRSEPGWMMAVWAVGIVVWSMAVPLNKASSQAIWMAKVPPDVQGRVFSVRRLIAVAAYPVAALVAGPLADYVMEPYMMADRVGARLFGRLVGTGPGAGMSLIFIFAALGGLALTAVASLTRQVRNVEDLVPDHGATGAVAASGDPGPEMEGQKTAATVAQS
jgi:MFS family permease